MGLLSGIKDTYKKSEAAVVVQNLLEHQRDAGLFEQDPAMTAKALVDAVWQGRPHVFGGQFWQRPHQLAVAACALANGLNLVRREDSQRDAFAISLGMLLSEFEINGCFYSFSNVDHRLLHEASATYSALANELECDALGIELSGAPRP